MTKLHEIDKSGKLGVKKMFFFKKCVFFVYIAEKTGFGGRQVPAHI